MFSLLFSRNNYTYLDLFKSPEMRKVSILIILLWMVISCIFDTTVRNISNLNFEFYFTFMAVAAIDFPAHILAILGINFLGRRWSASLSMNMCAIIITFSAIFRGRFTKREPDA